MAAFPGSRYHGFEAVNDATLEKKATSKPAPFVGYSRLLVEVHVAVRTTVPRGRTVLVVSRGDEQFVRLEGRRGWHFPRHEDGRWGGFHPASSQDAISHLESLRSQGAQYLVFPETAFWWLDYYGEFKDHLEDRYRLLSTSDTCQIYDIRASRAARDVGASGEADQLSPAAADVIKRLLPRDARIVIVTEGGNGLGGLDLERTVRYRPGPDDDSAVEAIGELAARGASFLVIPRSAFGWLAQRPGLRRHLNEHHVLVTRQQHLCEIYDLSRDSENL